MQLAQNSLFDKLGGMPAVNAAVDIFYDKIMLDDLVNHHFKRVHMTAQSSKLKMFLAYAFGAPMQYDGKNMHRAHAHLNISEAEFNAVAGHLVSTLIDLEVPQNLIDQVVQVVLTTKKHIVTKRA